MKNFSILVFTLMLGNLAHAGFNLNSNDHALNSAVDWLESKCHQFEQSEIQESCLLALEDSLKAGHNPQLPIIQFIKSEPRDVQFEVKAILEDYIGVVHADYSHLKPEDYPTWN